MHAARRFAKPDFPNPFPNRFPIPGFEPACPATWQRRTVFVRSFDRGRRARAGPTSLRLDHRRHAA
ncbi:hypothetical protein BZY94_37360 [Burkholderia territorii]|nr:hypothetical protein BZY94_37360 [Burkholderia territorii]